MVEPWAEAGMGVEAGTTPKQQLLTSALPSVTPVHTASCMVPGVGHTRGSWEEVGFAVSFVARPPALSPQPKLWVF